MNFCINIDYSVLLNLLRANMHRQLIIEGYRPITLNYQMEKLENKLTNRPGGPAIVHKRSTASKITHQGRQSFGLTLLSKQRNKLTLTETKPEQQD